MESRRQDAPARNAFLFAYDNLSRLTKIAATDQVLQAAYDEAGNLLTATTGPSVSVADSSVSYTYDDVGRLLTQTSQTDSGAPVTLTSAYDLAGNRTSLADSLGGLATFGYDGAGRLSELTSAAGTPAAAAVAIDHDLSGRLAGIVFPSGAATQVDYDSGGRIGTIAHTGSTSAVLSSFTMGYSATGNVTGITEPERTRSFGYDELERLTAETESPGPAGLYDYDAVGNRTTSPLSGSHSVDSANRLSQDDSFAYTYDDNGNLVTRTSTTGPTAGQVTTYHWNRRSQLTGIDLPPAAGGATVSYRYDALGRRIKKDVDGAVTGYVYDGDDIALETDAAGSLLRRYRHGDGIDEPLVLEEASGESFFYHRDHLGSVVMVTDEAGAVAAEYEYDAYGRRDAISEDVEQPYAFTGREWDDESGLYYYRARYYDPTTGRFLSEDPIGFAGGDANLYRYVKNNPCRWTDPTGMRTVRCTKPLDALREKFGPEVSEFAHAYGPYTYHQYSCVVRNGKVICGGQDHAGSPLSSPGKPSDDKAEAGQCEQSQPDDDCFERCLLSEWAKPRPRYGIPFGTDCQEYDDDVNARCREQCNANE